MPLRRRKRGRNQAVWTAFARWRDPRNPFPERCVEVLVRMSHRRLTSVFIGHASTLGAGFLLHPLFCFSFFFYPPALPPSCKNPARRYTPAMCRDNLSGARHSCRGAARTPWRVEHLPPPRQTAAWFAELSHAGRRGTRHGGRGDTLCRKCSPANSIFPRHLAVFLKLFTGRRIYCSTLSLSVTLQSREINSSLSCSRPLSHNIYLCRWLSDGVVSPWRRTRHCDVLAGVDD